MQSQRAIPGDHCIDAIEECIDRKEVTRRQPAGHGDDVGINCYVQEVAHDRAFQIDDFSAQWKRDISHDQIIYKCIPLDKDLVRY